MDGEAMKAVRGTRTQDEFAAWLNGQLSRKYDRSRISRWETGAERPPPDVAALVLLAGLSYKPTGKPTTIANVNQKGGVGKTTLSVGLAWTLAKLSARTLLIDCDSQGNGTFHTGVSRSESARITADGKTLYHVLTEKTPIADTIRKTSIENLDLIPSSIPLALVETEMSGITDRLRNKIAEIADRYDFFILDCSPFLGVSTINCLVASDYALVPVQAELFGIIGLDHLFDTIDNVRARANPDLKVLGVVPTMYSPRLSQDKASLEEINGAARGARVFEPIPRSTIYAQAAAGYRIPHDADIGAPGLTTFVEIAKTLGVRSHG